MPYRLRSLWLTVGALVLLTPVGACNCNNSTPTSTDEDSNRSAAESAAVAPTGAGAEAADQASGGSQPAAPPADVYPGMNFGQLSPENRTKFVDIAKGEVCPCPNAAESLHQCLQTPKQACGLARQVAVMMARGLSRGGVNKTDIQDQIAERVRKARASYNFELDGVPRKGPEDAPVKLVEFADFQCPHCREAVSVIDKLASKYGGQLAVYYKQFPLRPQSISTLAARASLAAHQQGEFWEMHHLLFDNQRSLSSDQIQTFARRIGLNVARFKKDVGSKQIGAKVARDRREGKKTAMTGTPAIFLNGRQYMGPNTVEALSEAIEARLEESSSAEQGG